VGGNLLPGRCHGYPLLHSAQYGGGTLYVLTIPDNFSDLYRLPAEVLTRVKETLLRDLYVRVESPAQVRCSSTTTTRSSLSRSCHKALRCVSWWMSDWASCATC